MDIDFARSKDRSIFNDAKSLVRTYGPENARHIMRRMGELRAARTLEDVPATPPSRRHKLSNRQEEYAVDLKHPLNLVFTPGSSAAKGEDGACTLSGVTGIVILRVELWLDFAWETAKVMQGKIYLVSLSDDDWSEGQVEDDSCSWLVSWEQSVSFASQGVFPKTPSDGLWRMS